MNKDELPFPDPVPKPPSREPVKLYLLAAAEGEVPVPVGHRVDVMAGDYPPMIRVLRSIRWVRRLGYRWIRWEWDPIGLTPGGHLDPGFSELREDIACLPDAHLTLFP